MGIFVIAFPVEIVGQKVINVKKPTKPTKPAKAAKSQTPQTTDFYVVTLPAGATISIDDKVVGTSPLEGIKHSRGQHEVKISKEGYETIIEKHNFGSAPVILNRVLKENYVEPATLYVNSSPEGAKVVIDGQNVGFTPLNGYKISKGYHQILLIKEGYDTLDVSEQIHSEQKMIDRQLVKAEVKKSMLYFFTKPAGATVVIDSITIGQTPINRYSIPQGKHKIKIELEGYESITKDTIVSNTTCIIDLQLQQKVVQPALFSIGTDPIDAEVYLNDTLIGKTPIIDYPVKPGDYTLEVKKKSHEPYATTLKFEQGKPLQLTQTLISTEPKTFNASGVEFKMIRVVGGTFTMGATPEQTNSYPDEKPAHEVTLSSYYIGETEVTQALFEAVMGRNPSAATGDLNNPVESVMWDDCIEFVHRLNAITGGNFRLPTEAEWEYAARGGNKSAFTLYAGSNELSKVAWNYENSSRYPHPVKTLEPNELGIYDMSGNVWEWCSDYKGDYPLEAQTNPQGPALGSERIIRGGGFSDEDTRNYRTAVRNYNLPGGCLNYIGFRIVCD